jgi:hypothetical protein
MASPVLVIVGSLLYLIGKCYPSAVFLWGDVGEWYERLVGRRRAVWQLVVGATLIGILSNLFVFGLADYLRR